LHDVSGISINGGRVHIDPVTVQADGTLAGSILTMNSAVRNLCNLTSCNRRAIADLALLDENFDVQITMCRGQVIFGADTARDRLSTTFGRSSEWK
jgi:N-acetylglucosamine-6-phosphate deacetylase